jgi:2-phospho-L-lactate guanylyltransferase
MTATPNAIVVVPIRSFRFGMGRLAAVLADDVRAALARTLAERVIAAAAPLRVIVVSSDDDVVAFAREHGATVIDDPGSLDKAAGAGRTAAAEAGAARVVIAHADLARATTLAWVAEFDGVTIVPDRHGTGTNVMCVPTDAPFVFAYGDGSRARHVAEALKHGLALRVVDDAELGWDIDEPADLDGVDGVVDAKKRRP